MTESPQPRISAPTVPSRSLDARVTTEERLATLTPAGGWHSWIGRALRDSVVPGVRAGAIDAALAKQMVEYFTAHPHVTGFPEAIGLVHGIASRFPALEPTLQPIRARIIERAEPEVAERAASAIREGRHEDAIAAVQGFLQLAARYAEGLVEPALLTETLEGLLSGGDR